MVSSCHVHYFPYSFAKLQGSRFLIRLLLFFPYISVFSDKNYSNYDNFDRFLKIRSVNDEYSLHLIINAKLRNRNPVSDE